MSLDKLILKMRSGETGDHPKNKRKKTEIKSGKGEETLLDFVHIACDFW